MLIKFKNWEKYNGRSDIKTFTWFRMSNTFLQDPKIWSLEIEEVYAMLYLICEASKSGKKGEVYLNREHARVSSRVPNRTLDRTIEKLQQLQMIEIRTLRGTFGSIPATDRQTDITDKQTNNILPDSDKSEPRLVFDFDALYKKYPRKEGKQKGLLTCKAQIKTQEDYENLSKAIDRYCAHLKKSASEPRFIKHFSTFMASWRDWLESDTGTVIDTQKEKKETDRKALLERLK